MRWCAARLANSSPARTWSTVQLSGILRKGMTNVHLQQPPREVEEGLVVVAVHLALEEWGSPGLNPLLDSIPYLRSARLHTQLS